MSGRNNGISSLSQSSSPTPPQFDSISRASGSEFSFSGGGGSGEITADKYARLATEYSKIRSQFVVLRKAFIEEKGRGERLHDQLQKRDQDVRKLEQESESLCFRNTQLSRRIGVLQSDLDHESSGADKRNSRGFFNFSESSSNTRNSLGRVRSQSNASSISTNSVGVAPLENDLFEELNQELKKKMVENEQCKSEILSLESKFAEESALSERRLKEADAKSKGALEELNKEVAKLTNSLNKVRADKTDLETDIKKLRFKMEESENLSKKTIDDMKRQMENIRAEKDAQVLQQQESTTVSQCAITEKESQSPQNLPRSGSFSGGEVRSAGRVNSVGLPRSGSLSTQNRSVLHTIRNSSSTLELQQLRQQQSFSQDPSSNHSGNVRIPSHSSVSYRDKKLRNSVIDEFSNKLLELFCALSTLHSHLAKKCSILFAMFNNQDFHFYLDSSDSATSLQNQNILRQLSQILQSGYDTHLVQMEESTKQFVALRKRAFNQFTSESDEMTPEFHSIMAEIKRFSAEIVEEFSDYLAYLNKAAPFMVMALNSWCKTLKSFNSQNASSALPAELVEKLSCNEKRFDLIQKQENLALNIQEFLRVLGQIVGSVKLMLTRSLNSDRFLTAFNQCLQRVNALEQCHEELKQNITVKYALEHELGITARPTLLQTDDCLLSALMFVKTIVTDIRVLMEVHYFFFVCSTPKVSQSNQQQQPQQVSPTKSSGRLGSPSSTASITANFIPEEDDLQEEDALEDVDAGKSSTVNSELQKRTLEIESLKNEKEQFVLELEHKALCMERDSKRITELELRVQELMTQIGEQQNKKEEELSQKLPGVNATDNRGKLNDQASITSNVSFQTNSPLIDCFGVLYPAAVTNGQATTLSPSSENGAEQLSTLIGELSLEQGMENADNSQGQQLSATLPSKDQYWREQLRHILDSLEKASSKLSATELECVSLRQLYGQLTNSKSALEDELEDKEKTLYATQEEARISVENYQSQLQTLTEHLAILNETIAAQCEQIDSLRFELHQSSHPQTPGSPKVSSSSSFVSKAFSGFKKTS